VLALERSPKSRWTRTTFSATVHGLGGGAEAEDIAKARVGGLVAVGLAHAAADGDVEAGEFFVFDDGDVGEVLRVDVHVVARGDGHADLEFARR